MELNILVKDDAHFPQYVLNIILFGHLPQLSTLPEKQYI